MSCSICRIPLCEECISIKDNEILCSKCYIKSITKKNIKNNPTKDTLPMKSMPIVTRDRVKLFLKDAEEKQKQKDAKQEDENKILLEKKKDKEKKVITFCNWHEKRVAEYTCFKCKKIFL